MTRTLVNPHFIYALSTFLLLFAARCGGASEHSDTDQNLLVANAGDDQIRHVMDTITLDGTASIGPEGDPPQYQWTQKSGPSVVLAKDDTAAPSFTAPSQPAQLVFALEVKNRKGVTHSDEVLIEIMGYKGARAGFPPSARMQRFDFEHTSYHFAIQDGFAYVTLFGGTGLAVVDLEHPERGAQMIEQVPAAEHVVIEDRKAYLATTKGLAIVDLDQPDSGVEIIEANGSASSLAIDARKAYLVGVRGLAIVDLNGSSTEVQTFSTGESARHVAIDAKKRYALVAAGEEGLFVVDLLAPKDSPRQIPFADLEGKASAQYLTIVGDTAYVAAGKGGLVVVDLNNLEKPPRQVFFSEFNDFIRHVAVEGRFAYLAGDFFSIVDLDDPSGERSRIIADGSAFYATVDGSYAYIGSRYAFSIVDLHSPKQRPRRIHVGGGGHHIEVRGSHAYVSGEGGLSIVDLNAEDPADDLPRILTDDVPTEVVDVGRYRITRDFGSHELSVVDLDSPTKKEQQISFGGDVEAMAVREPRVYLGLDTKQLAVIDLDDISREPQTIPLGQRAWQIAVSEHNAYIATSSRQLLVVDLKAPGEAPLQIPVVGEVHHTTLDPDEKNLYVAAGEKGLAIVDTAHPTRMPKQIPIKGESTSITVDRRFAYVATGDDGLVILDVNEPETPLLRTAQNAEQVRLTDDTAYVIGADGVQTFEFHPPAQMLYQQGFLGISRIRRMAFLDSKPHVLVFSGAIALRQAPVILSTDYAVESPGAVLDYAARWEEYLPGVKAHTTCTVTGGECDVPEFDSDSRTAKISWTLPVTPGDYELAIKTGNYFYYTTTRDRVSVR